MDQDQESTYALLAAGAYWDIRSQDFNQAPIPPGWIVLNEFTDTGSGGAATTLGSGFSARVYQGPNNKIVIAYAGTEFNLTAAGFYNDFVNGNIPLAVGADGEQARQAAWLYERVQARFGTDANISFTGHSLGGGLAGLMAVWFDRPAIVFDPAPFELAAKIGTPTGPNLGPATAMMSAYRYLLTKGYNDPKFASYDPARDFLLRESRVASYAVMGEVLESIPGVPRIEAFRISRLLGAAPDLSGPDKHSIDLLAAVLLNGEFELAVTALPKALPLLFDGGLFGPAPLGAQQNLLVKLVRGEVGVYDEFTGAQTQAPTGLLTKFTADLNQLTASDGMAAQASMQRALIIAAMEYYYFKAAASATAAFTSSGNGIHFKLSDSGVLISKALPRLVNAVNGYLGNDELSALGAIRDPAQQRDDFGTGRLMNQDAWHVQTGTSGMNWTASGSDKDAAIGGAQIDILDGGAGDDILIGGAGRDFLTGGADADILIGGVDVDALDGGTGNDTLLGGQGADIYTFSDSWGTDTVQDSDGQGVVVVTGLGNITGDGAKKVAENTWQTEDKKVNYTLVSIGQSRSDLIITFSDRTDTIHIENWGSGQLGINLSGELAVPVTTASYSGDFIKKQFDNSTSYEFQNGNYVSIGASPGAQDVITGSAAADEIKGMAGNDALAGRGGDDLMDGGEGDDLILGGPGADTIKGGDGKDYIFGSGVGPSVGALTYFGSTEEPAPTAEGAVRTRGLTWVIFDAGTDSNGFKIFKIKGAYPYTEYADKGNVIDAGAGDDWVSAGWANDSVHGGDDNDEINGLAGDDVLFGDDGNDDIFGDGVDTDEYLTTVHGIDHGDDILVGGAGNDSLTGQGGEDELYGGTGDDKLWGDDTNDKSTPFVNHGDDYLDGGDGTDQLSGGGKDDILFGGIGNDSLFGDASPENLAGQYHGKDYLDGEEGDDFLEGGGQADDLFGGAGNDMLWGDSSKTGLSAADYGGDYLDGEAGNDSLNGGGKGDTLFGGEGDDQLSGDDELLAADEQGDDYLDGGVGDDALWGDGGKDTLIGADGADYLNGGAGDDLLDGGNGIDALYGEDGSDTLSGSAGDDHLEGGDGADFLQGGEGDDALLGGAGNDTLDGGGGSDYLNGGEGDDTYIIAAGSSPISQPGAEGIEDNQGLNTFVFSGSSARNLQVFASANGDGNLVVATTSTNGVVILNGAAGDGNVYQLGDRSTYKVSELVGNFSSTAVTSTDAAGSTHALGGYSAEALSATTFEATISGGRGNDTLSGSGGSNTYRYSLGDGADSLTDSSAKVDVHGVAMSNRLVFGAGISAADLRLSGAAGALVVNVGGSAGDSITFGSFDQGNASALSPIDNFVFSDGLVLTYAQLIARGFDGGAGNDVVSATAGNDRIDGHAGNDNLLGQDGNDTLTGGAGNDTLRGGSGSDVYLFAAGDGQDVINNSDAGSDQVDTLRLLGLNSTDITLSTNGLDLIIKLRNSSDQVQVLNHLSTGSALNRIEFANGAVWAEADITANLTFSLTEGADNVVGTAANDVFAALGGNDTVLGLAGNDVLDGGLGNDSLNGGDGADTLYGGDSNDSLTGANNDDWLEGGAGNDALTGGLGNDRYVFGRGDGQDTINNLDATVGRVDTLQFRANVAPADVLVSRSGLDLLLSIAGTTDSVQLLGYMLGDGVNDYAVNQIKFADGTNWSVADIKLKLLQGTTGKDSLYGYASSADVIDAGAGDDYGFGLAGADTINGGDGNDSLYGDDGDDRLDGGADIDLLLGGNGNDTLIDGETMMGGAGDDTYVLGATGTGNAFIAETVSGADALVLPTGVAPSAVTVRQGYNSSTQGYDDLALYVSGPSGARVVTVAQYFYSPTNDYKLEEIRFADGTVWSVADVLARNADAQRTEGADRITGYRWDETISALGGSDTVNGGLGDDSIDGGAGYDSLLGGAGNDTLEGGLDNDAMDGGAGNDTFKIGRTTGRDTIIDDSGTDRVLFGADVLPGDVTLFREGNDLVIAVAMVAAQTRVLGHFAGTGQIESIEFGNGGVVWDAAAIASQTLAGTVNAMVGTAGNDTFVVDSAGDSITEAANQGTDTVQSSVSWTLGSNLENLTLTGYLDLRGNGNALDNVITGNAGNNALNGAAGADTLAGGAGDDVYYADAIDAVVEAAGEGFDTVSVTGDAVYEYLLANNVEQLMQTNVRSGYFSWDGEYTYRKLTGNALDNAIDFDRSSNYGAILDGGAGADVMRGSNAADIYVVDNVGDVVDERGPHSVNSLRDTVRSSINYVLGDWLENLELIGSGAISGTGNTQDNVLDGSTNTSANVLTGGLGNDSYRVGAGDTVVEVTGEGIDTVSAVGLVSYSLGANIENATAVDNGRNAVLTGNALNNQLTGFGGMSGVGNTLDGGLGADTLTGGAGDDVYVVDDAGDVIVESSFAGGTDTVQTSISYALGSNLESLSLTGTAAINGTGNASNNRMLGNSADNSLSAGSGNDTLDGGTGNDTLAGGTGNDTYGVDSLGAAIIELADEGLDTVQSSINYSLGANVENLTLTGTANLNATGNTADNFLIGNTGANLLTGGAGNDTLDGGAGNDTYRFARGAGADTIDALEARVGKLDTLELGAGIATSDVAITREGNDLIVSIVGTSDSVRVKSHFSASAASGYQIDQIRFADNTVWSVAGIRSQLVNHAPVLVSALADQTVLQGWTSTFTLPAGSFADLDVEDVITFTATLSNGAALPGWVSFDAASLTFTVDASNADQDTSSIKVTATDGAGLSVSDVFDLVVQGQPATTIYGTESMDFLSAGSGNDTIFAGGGDDYLFGGIGNNVLWGEAGDDFLYGNRGRDTMMGGAGNDNYSVDRADDVVVENADEGSDRVDSSVDWTLGANLESLYINGAATRGTGNALSNYIQTASDSRVNYVLDGGAGADTMQGGLGNDTYVVDNANDVITEYSSVTANGVTFINTGIDAAEASVSYGLGYGVENLTLTGSAAIDGTGNDLNNIITGNSAANRLHGGWAGVDTLIGGAGDDTYVVADTGDVIVETAGGGIDTIESSISWTLGAELENLTLSGTDTTSATGNATANVLTGNAAANMLDGGLGADTMAGGDGDDTYVVDSAADVVAENALEGNDGVLTSVTYILGANVESLTLTGVAAINGTGNAGANVLTGNDAVNVLTGGAGADTLDGGADSDTMAGSADDDIYIVESVGDTVLENAAEGNDTVLSSVSYVLGANVEALALTGLTNLSGTGNALGNTLTGNGGDNILDGGAGADTMAGGAGSDTYIVDNTGDAITEDVGAGADSVLSSASFTLGDNIESLTLTGAAAINATGNIDNNLLVGNSGANTLDGGEGDDTLAGGQGDDIYVVDSASDVIVENAAEGTDTVTSSVTLTLGANVENLTLTGWSAIDGTGNAAANVLIGNDGANTLDGATGTDTMMGGADDDTYVVDDASDVITENVSEGADTVQSSVSFALDANVENLILTGAANLNANGNSLANSLTGNGGTNMLDGGAGADTMAGGAGNDTYIVDNTSDVVAEGASAGTDLVQSSVSLTLAANVENLTLTGSAAINATGNTANNSLVGNSGANTLDGGAGADSMAGGMGDDVYVVDSATDVIVENAGEGTDTVQASVTLTLAAHLENLTLTGTSAINATGNTVANVLTGNSGVNTLSGGAGADTMLGGAGNDTYVVDDTGDVVTENASAGTDAVQSSVSFTLGTNVENLTLTGAANTNATGNTVANSLTGNSGDNTLSGGAGADTMTGGLGNDTYIVDNTADVVTEAASAGSDLVQSSVTLTLAANVENLTLTTTAAINATGNTLANVLTGNAGVNRLSGGTGADTMVGGAGNDSYVVDNVGDVVTELAAEGTDLVEASITWTLAAEIEKLTLTGTSGINATGNTLANTLLGNAGANRLDGGAGADTMTGAAGNDTYVVDNAADSIIEEASGGTDTVESGINWTLGAELEKLLLTGAGNINGTGNALANTLTGNAGNNVLNGGTGIDTLVGGAGDDTYVVDVAGDVVTEAAGAGVDLVQTSLTYTLGANVENLTLIGTTAINGTGNASANVLIGNSGNNTLTAAAGNDTLDGAAGADTLIGGTGNDTYVMGRGYGAELLQDNDATAGNSDVMQFLSGVASDQIWFRQVSNDLEVSIIGTTDKVLVQNWYLGSQYRVEQFKTSDGKTLLDSKVQDLVNAMASFAPPAIGQTTLPANYQTSLLPVIAADWGP